jgi:WD40 repeat protein
MADIFLSHSSTDNDAADQIKSWLERDRKGWSVFLDRHTHDGILAGQGWQERLRNELQSCRLVLAIITPDWLASRWCFTEAVTATFRGKDFIAVVPDVLPEGALDRAPPIVHERQRQPLDLVTGAGWEELLHALDRSGLDPSQWFSIPDGVGPYPGFVAFEERDAGVFFGRDQEITQYLDELNLLKAPDRAQALVISGGSGSGKSSLLKAGLIPRLRRQPGWLVIPPFDPSREPIHALFSVLRAAAQAAGAAIDLPTKPPQTAEVLTECLQDGLRAIEEQSEAWILLPLDQAEGLVAGSYGGSATDGSLLLVAIGQILASRTRRLVAVLTIRTEFVPALDHALPSEVRTHDRSLRSITALSEIIEKPAARFGIELEEGLTGRMIEDTRGAGALPLLAYTLRELNEKYGKDKRLTVAEYEELGGVEGAIEKKLHEAFSDPQPTAKELDAFRRCFVRQLVRVDEGAAEGERYLRAAVALKALPDGAGRLVDRLREVRLLVSGDDGTIAVAHERLIRNWTDVPLQTWLAEDRDDRKLIDNLKSLLVAHRDGGPLLSDKLLLDAKDFMQRDRSLKDDEPELAQFIETSVGAEQRRQRRQRWFLGGTVAASLVFLAVAIGAVWYYIEAQEKTRVAEAERDRALRTQSLFLADLANQQVEAGNTTTAMLLALEALPRDMKAPQRPYVPEAEAALFGALREHREVARLEGHTGAVTQVAFVADGERLLSVSDDGTARIWDVASARELAVLPVGGDEQVPVVPTVSPDGQFVLTRRQNGPAELWDVTTEVPRRVWRWPEEGGSVRRAEFMAGSRWAFILLWGGEAFLWDVQQRTQVNPFLAPDWRSDRVAFSPNGSRMISWKRGDGAVLWNTETWKIINFLVPSGNSVQLAGFTPVGERIVVVPSDSPPGVWNARSGEKVDDLMPWEGQQGPSALTHVQTLVFDRDSLVAAASRGTLVVWDLRSRRPRASIDLGVYCTHRNCSFATPIFSRSGFVAVWNDRAEFEYGMGIFDRDGKLLERGGSDLVPSAGPSGFSILSATRRRSSPGVYDDGLAGRATLRSADSGRPISVIGAADSDVVFAVFGPGGQVAATSTDGAAYLQIDGQRVHVLRGHKDGVRHAAFNPDGTVLATASDDGSIRLWSTDTFGPLASDVDAKKPAEFSAQDKITERRGTVEVTDGHARVTDPRSGRTVVIELDHADTERIVDARFTRDGRRLVIVTRNRQSGAGTVTLWSSDNNVRLASVAEVERGASVRTAFSPDGTRLLVWQPGIVHLWNVVDGASVRPLDLTGTLRLLNFSPDGSRLVTVTEEGDARLWSAQSGEHLTRLGAYDTKVTYATFDSQSRFVATGSDDGRVRLWDTSNLASAGVLEGHDARIEFLNFSPNGQRLMSGSGDGSARLWDVALGKQVALLGGHTRRVSRITFDVRGESVLIEHGWKERPKRRLWRVFPTTQAILEHARGIIGQELTREERRHFMLE